MKAIEQLQASLEKATSPRKEVSSNNQSLHMAIRWPTTLQLKIKTTTAISQCRQLELAATWPNDNPLRHNFHPFPNVPKTKSRSHKNLVKTSVSFRR